MMSRSLFLYWCAFLWCSTSFGADHPSYLENIASGDGKQEKEIAAVFNKVAFGGVVTTKRSISLKYQAASDGLMPPVTTTSTRAPPTSERPVEKTRTRQDLTATNTRNQQAEQAFTTNIPPFLAPKTSFPVSYTTPSLRADVPSYVPPVRTFFTPPLPPEYANPFADKPTLRGSNADPGGAVLSSGGGSAAGGGRRPAPPPPALRAGQERIPLRPPDLPETNQGPAVDRKKPLNTPSFHRPADVYDSSESPASARPSNESAASEFDFVPILHYPSVSRILSGSNGRKDFPDVRRPALAATVPPRPAVVVSRPVVPAVVPPPRQPSPAPAAVPTPATEAATIPDTLDIESKLAPPSPPPSRPQPPPAPSINLSVTDHNLDLMKPSRKDTDSSWLLAWDIHVYLIATLFLLLAVLSLFNLVRINTYKRLLSHGYYITVHSFLLIIGTLRCLYLFLDAYNAKNILPKPFSELLLHIVSPLITSTFLVLFLFILRASKVDVLTSHLQRPLFVAMFILCHVFACVGFELSADVRPALSVLPLVGQCVYVVVLVALGTTYLYVYKSVSNSVQRKAENVFGSSAHKPSAATTVRTALAAALLALLMAATQMYGIFGGLDKLAGGREMQWLWWGYQFSVRFVEVALCFLLLWAGVQAQQPGGGGDDEKNSENSGFALFRCGRCATDNEPADDIYPAVCVTNQAIADYTLRTGKKVYDDGFPLNSLHRGAGGSLQRDLGRVTPLYEEPDRRSLRKAQENYAATRTLARYDEVNSSHHAPTSTGGVSQHRAAPPMFNYAASDFSTNERRPPASSRANSMLVAENGFVRFRALQEPEEHDSDDGLMER